MPETTVREATLPGVSLKQKITYHPDRKGYEEARDERLSRMLQGDGSAFQSPSSEPYKVIRTEAGVGFGIRGFGVSKGSSITHTQTASSEALSEFISQSGGGSGGPIEKPLMKHIK